MGNPDDPQSLTPDLGAFAKVAPFLKHPLVLIGFVAFLVLGFPYALVTGGLLEPVGAERSGELVSQALLYGFFLALAVLVVGVALQLRKSLPRERDVAPLSPVPLPTAPTGVEPPPQDPRGHYLRRLIQSCQALPLQELGGDEGAKAQVVLNHVYIDLDTTAKQDGAKDPRAKGRGGAEALVERDEDAQALPCIDAARQERRLVLLGDPGAGKSTFAHLLLSQVAAAATGTAEPPPGFSPDLLPLLVVLRDLETRLRLLDLEGLAPADRRKALTDAVVAQVGHELARLRAGSYALEAQRILSEGGVFLVLDGLDEVPEAQRPRIREAVLALEEDFRPQRVLVTCRIRSYQGEATLPGYTSHTIAPLDEEKIRAFTTKWYQAQELQGRFDAEKAQERSQDLTRAALSPELVELSSNPMLLTTMALVHQREIGLPRERARLYDQAVEVLLWRWQKKKTGELAPSTDLARVLGDSRRLRGALEHLAYAAHATGDAKEAADLSFGQAVEILASSRHLGDAGLASELLHYVDHRAGLLVGRGGEIGRPSSYTFPHRTFQEYLAGCHMVGRYHRHKEYFERAGEGDFWSEAAQLGGEELFHVRRGENDLLELLYSLCPGELTSQQEQRALLWCGKLAVLLGPTTIAEAQDGPRRGSKFLAELRHGLVHVLGGDLGAVERSEAGVALAHLGDPRQEVTSVAELQVCPVAAGTFRLGSEENDEGAHEDEKPAKDCDVPYLYWLGRYPVTQAQFGEFVAAGGYRDAVFWPEAREAGLWRDGRLVIDDEVITEPLVLPEPYCLPNHPVVGVSWFEARAFCRWMTASLQGAGRLAEDWIVALPSEIEWEKAARGGERVPRDSCWVRSGEVVPGGESKPNEVPRRLYPWGDTLDPSFLNFHGTGINATSAVGCFPRGVSPHGCQDMSGNVWEWTRSSWGPYPYPDDKEKRQERETVVGSASVCVVRGGSFFARHLDVRCAARNGLGSAGRHYDIGFRVAVLPLGSLDL